MGPVFGPQSLLDSIPVSSGIRPIGFVVNSLEEPKATMEEKVLIALGLTLFAGLSTGLGSLVVFFTKKPKTTLLSFGLGFASGVMVYISLVELLPEGAHVIGA